MSIRRTLSGPGLPAGFPFALAASSGNVCFISGMPALDPQGRYQPGTFADELALAWHNILSIAAEAGHSQQDIVYVQCVLADIADYDQLNAWWRAQFTDPTTAPARFTFQAGALPFGCKIEIQAAAGREP